MISAQDLQAGMASSYAQRSGVANPLPPEFQGIDPIDMSPTSTDVGKFNNGLSGVWVPCGNTTTGKRIHHEYTLNGYRKATPDDIGEDSEGKKAISIEWDEAAQEYRDDDVVLMVLPDIKKRGMELSAWIKANWMLLTPEQREATGLVKNPNENDPGLPQPTRRGNVVFQNSQELKAGRYGMAPKKR